MQGVNKRAEQAAATARDLILFADGAEEAGLIRYAQMARTVARETVWLAQALEQEQSARVAVQKQRDDGLRILADHAGAALARTA